MPSAVFAPGPDLPEPWPNMVIRYERRSLVLREIIASVTEPSEELGWTVMTNRGREVAWDHATLREVRACDGALLWARA
jgi:hypothetical protein